MMVEQTKTTKTVDPSTLESKYFPSSKYFADSIPFAPDMGELLRTGMNWTKTAIELSEEMIAFGQRRLQDNVEAFEALGKMKSTGDWIAYQKKYVDRATAEYLNEAERMRKRLTILWSPWFSRTEETK